MSSAAAIHSHQQSLLQAPILAPPSALLPVPVGHWAPALHWSKRDLAQFKFPVGCGELAAMVSPALGSLPSRVNGVSWGDSL